MTEEPIIIEMNISHYGALLKLDLDDKKLSIVEQLLAQAEANPVLAIDARKPQEWRARVERTHTPPNGLGEGCETVIRMVHGRPARASRVSRSRGW